MKSVDSVGPSTAPVFLFFRNVSFFAVEQLICVMKNQATCDHRVVHVRILNPRHADEP